MNTYQEFEKKEKEQENRKKRVKQFLIAVGVGLIILIIYLIMASRPLDEIKNYEVEVTPQPGGALEITYRYDWKVLNSTSEGPLEWVKLGMANPDYGIVAYGGAITGLHRDPDSYSNNGPFASFSLDRAYYKGETASFWFTVTQSSMLCNNTENSDQPFYDFTPGWFDHIRVKHYKFYWHDFAEPVEHNADDVQGGTMIWEGSLAPGKSRNMKVTYDLSAFRESPYLVTWSPSQGKNSESNVNPSIIIIIIFVTSFIGFFLLRDGSSYESGRGFGSNYMYHGRDHHHGGGGGGCACACAGCACACACAGGGRAGCSQKDFYYTVHLPPKLPELQFDNHNEEKI